MTEIETTIEYTAGTGNCARAGMKAMIAATQMARAGVRYFLLTTCSHFEPGSAPSRLKAKSIRELEVIELNPQKACAMTKPANKRRPPLEPRAFLTMSSTGLPLFAVAA